MRYSITLYAGDKFQCESAEECMALFKSLVKSTMAYLNLKTERDFVDDNNFWGYVGDEDNIDDVVSWSCYKGNKDITINVKKVD